MTSRHVIIIETSRNFTIINQFRWSFPEPECMRQRWEMPRSCFSLARSDSGSAGSPMRSRRFSRSSQSSVRGGQSRTRRIPAIPLLPSREVRRFPSRFRVPVRRPASSGEAWRTIPKAKTARNPKNRRPNGGKGAFRIRWPGAPAFKTGPSEPRRLRPEPRYFLPRTS